MDYFSKAVSHLYVMEKHRGEIVEKAVRNSGIALTKIAKELGVSYKTLYNKFEEVGLSFDFIRRIGEVIHYDFSNDFEELYIPSVQEPQEKYKTDELYKCQSELEHWRNKAFEYMEKYNHILEKHSQITNRQTG